MTRGVGGLYPESVMPRKSSLSGRYRFYAGSLVHVTDEEKKVESEKIFLFENFIPLTTVRHSSQSPIEVNANTSPSSKDYHRRLSITTVGSNNPSFLWQDLQFWEDLFCDAVAQERDLIGMDTGADELLDRYRSLAENEKRVLENDEDRLLSVILYNLTAFMLLMQVSTNLQNFIEEGLNFERLSTIYLTYKLISQPKYEFFLDYNWFLH